MNAFSTILDELDILSASTSAPVSIGDLILQGHEVPERITVGGTQVLSIHKLPGGSRIVDAMGPDEGGIAWHGVFVGPTAARRARYVDAMRQQGLPLPLSFGDYTFTVVISHFEYDYSARGTLIAYRIKTEKVFDDSGFAFATDNTASAIQSDLLTSAELMQSFVAAVTSYASAATSTGASTISLASTGLGALAGQVTDCVALNATSTTGAVTLSSQLETAASGVQAALLNPTYITSNFSDPTLSSYSSGMLVLAAAQSGMQATLVTAGSYLNRANSTLAQANGRSTAPLVHA